jgi:deoxyribose-phosphate aldolase
MLLPSSCILAVLQPEITRAEIQRACAEATRLRVASVCVHPSWAKLCYELLLKTGVALGVAVGYPFGVSTTLAKIFEADQSIEAGAREIHMAMHIGALRSGLRDFVLSDVAGVAQACRRVKQPGALLTVAIEPALLGPPDRRLACQLARQGGADGVQVGTGFHGAATAADVRLAKAIVGPDGWVTAFAGGGPDDAEALLAAGATRVLITPGAPAIA